MRYRLVPGLLSEQPIKCDDAHQKLMVGLYLVPLSATQYRLVAALVCQRLRWEADTDNKEPMILTVPQLQRVAALPVPSLVKKHLSEASMRLPSDELRIANLHGYGYGIFLPWEVPLPGTAQAPFPDESDETRLRDF